MANLRVLSVVGLLVALISGYGGPVSAAAAGSAPCAVTLPNGVSPSGSASKAMPPVPPALEGNSKLGVKLWPLGVIVAKSNVIGPDGSIGIKFPWWRAVAGRLSIRAVRLDADAPVVTGHVPGGYGPRGFQASGIDFPAQGCWKVTGRVGAASLSFVALIVKADGNGY